MGGGCEIRGRLRCAAASIGYRRRIRKGSVHSSFTPASWNCCQAIKIRRAPAPGGVGRRGRARELVELIGLKRYWDIETGILSYGQKKLVALAAALMPHPKIVVLDEPVAGVNPSRIREIEVALQQLNRAGETFLIVEHNVEFITNLCHHVIVLEQGRKLTEGTAAEIHTDPRVLEAYLGMTPEMAKAEMRGAA